MICRGLTQSLWATVLATSALHIHMFFISRLKVLRFNWHWPTWDHLLICLCMCLNKMDKYINLYNRILKLLQDLYSICVWTLAPMKWGCLDFLFLNGSISCTDSESEVIHPPPVWTSRLLLWSQIGCKRIPQLSQSLVAPTRTCMKRVAAITFRVNKYLHTIFT